MTTDSTEPLEGVDPDSATPEQVDDQELRAALTSSIPLVRQRGIRVCRSFAAADPQAVEPYLDLVATAAGETNSGNALHAISVLHAVAESTPAALEGRVAPLAACAGAEIVDVQLTAAAALSTTVVSRPDIVAPFAERIVVGIRDTAPEGTPTDYSEYVDDAATRQTLHEHDQSERERRDSARETLINVVVAVLEADAESAAGVAADLASLLDDDHPAVVGGAIDGLAEITAVDPGSVRPARAQLVERLSDPWPMVRARAVRALGELGDEEVVSDLEAVAADDENEDIRAVAAETAEYLASDG